MKSYLFPFALLLSSALFSQNQAIKIQSGSLGYVEVSDNNVIDFSSKLTIEAWINVQDTVGSKSIVHKGWCGGSDNGYYFGIEGGKLVHSWSEMGSGSCTFASSAKTDLSVISKNVCTHVAVVHSTNSIQFFVDGEPVATSLITGGFNGIRNSTEPLRIGAYKNLAGSIVFPMYGYLDEVRLWNVVRTATQIDLNKNLALSGNEVGLVAYYDFDNVIAQLGSTVTNGAITGSVLNGDVVGTSPFQIINACETITLGVDNADEFKNVHQLVSAVYPNPSSTDITVVLNDFRNIQQIDLMDMSGKLVARKIPNSSSVVFSLVDKDWGCYMVRVFSVDGSVETKTVVH